jgi:hypothetical protein
MLTYLDIAARVDAGETDEQIAAALPATSAWWRPLTSAEALRWLSKSGRMIAAEKAAASETTPVELRAAIRATLVALQRADTSLDFRVGSDDRLLLLGCAQAGIFQMADVLSLIESTRLRPDPTVEEIAGLKAEQERLAACGVVELAYSQRYTRAAEALRDAKLLGMSAEQCEAAFLAQWEA